jgi:hypothetical protein
MTNSISIRLLVKDHCSLTVILKSKLEKIYFFIYYTNLYTVYGYFRGGAQQIIQIERKNIAEEMVLVLLFFNFKYPKLCYVYV